MGLTQVAENARLLGQLDDGLREQLSYIGILHHIVNVTPDVQENVYEIFGALNMVFRLESSSCNTHAFHLTVFRYEYIISLQSSASSLSHRTFNEISPRCGCCGLICLEQPL